MVHNTGLCPCLFVSITDNGVHFVHFVRIGCLKRRLIFKATEPTNPPKNTSKDTQPKLYTERRNKNKKMMLWWRGLSPKNIFFQNKKIIIYINILIILSKKLNINLIFHIVVDVF